MQIPLNIGVDVAKDQVVVACDDTSFTPRSIRNCRTALSAWLRRLPAGSRIGLEATNVYHQCLADLAHALGFAVFVLNPKDLHHYAKGVGRRAKTDRVDAQVIARYVAHEHQKLHAYIPPSPEQHLMEQLLRRRARLVSLRVALQATMAELGSCRAQSKAVVLQLDALVAALEAQLKQLLKHSETSRQAQLRLQSIPGVGLIVGAGLSVALQRLPFKSADAFVAFTGLDPRPCDSGKKVGRRRLSKRGPSELRRLLFNAAMAGSCTKAWKPFYQHHRQRGLASTEALIVLARKIARTAWSVFHHQTSFDPTRLHVLT
jgi:transposase